MKRTMQRLFPAARIASPYVKDGINDYVVHGQQEAVNPEHTGHQGRGALSADGRPGQSMTVRLRLTQPALRRRATKSGDRPSGRL